MANRYWVGTSALNRSGTWDTTTTSVWSTSSGGAGGASVPTAADSVFFPNAATYTVTLSGTLACLDITVSAGTVTFASSVNLSVSGSMSLIAGTVWTATGSITFNATTTGKTITTNNISIASSFSFSGVGGGWTLGSAFTSTGNISITAGTFNTGNFAVSASAFSTSGSSTKSISFGSSTITLSALTGMNILGTGLTFNAGTSQINLTATGLASFVGNGQNFYNVSYTAARANTLTFTGANTFNNLTITAPASAIQSVIFNTSQTINGTLTISGSGATNRLFLQSSAFGTGVSIICNALSAPDCDFLDIAFVGLFPAPTPTRAGDCGGNLGINFPAPKTVYWNLAGAQNLSATGWASTSGGTPNINNFPLAQDTAVFDNTGSVTGTISVGSTWNIGTIDMSARTSAMTFNSNANLNIYGNWKNGSGTTITGSSRLNFTNRGTTQTITSAGKTFTQSFLFQNWNGTIQLLDNFETSYSASTVITLLAGTFNLDSHSCSVLATTAVSSFTSTTTTFPRSVNFGSGGSLFFLTSGTTVWNVASTIFSVSGTGSIRLGSASAKTFVGGGVNYSGVTLENASQSALTISGSNTFENLIATSLPSTITFTAGTTTTFNTFTLSGLSGNLVTINSTGAAATLSKSSGTVSCDYLSISNSTVTGGATWYAGANSTNVSGNTGWIFSAAPTTNSGSFFLLF